MHVNALSDKSGFEPVIVGYRVIWKPDILPLLRQHFFFCCKHSQEIPLLRWMEVRLDPVLKNNVVLY